MMDILACNSANKPSFQNLTKSCFAQRSYKKCRKIFKCTFYIYGALGKKAFCRILKRRFISRITGQNIRKLQNFAISASFLYSYIKRRVSFPADLYTLQLYSIPSGHRYIYSIFLHCLPMLSNHKFLIISVEPS